MNKKYPLISVVMLNYNGLKYLKKTIPPILKLDYPNYEFIIVDNGSSDGSIEFIKKFKKIKLIESPKKREKNFACNYAINKAKGNYILLLDNDAEINTSNLLMELYDRYSKSEVTGIIGLSFIDYGSPKSKSYGGYFSYYFIMEKKAISKKFLKHYDCCKISYPEGKGFFIKKSIWKEVGGYDDYLKFGGDDNDLGIKTLLMGYKNFLYSRTIQTHWGIPERENDEKFNLKFKEMFHAHMYTILKNYKSTNLIIAILGLSAYSIISSIKQSLFRLNIGPFLAFFKGYFTFFESIPHALNERKKIQSKRKIKRDVFLTIKPQKLR